ncbi:MAG: hypothetical protein RIR97_162 [Pseudomonadota bacterium]
MAQPTRTIAQHSVSVAEGEFLFANMLDALPVATALMSIDGVLLYANARFLEDFQQPSGQRDLSFFRNSVHPDDQTQIVDAVNTVRTGKTISEKLELRVLNKELSYRWMSAQLALAPYSSLKSAPDMILQLSDIHAVKCTTLLLQQQESRWNSALVSSGLGVWDHNFATGDYFYSDTWKQMRGMDPSETVAADTDIWIETVHPEDRDRVLFEIGRQNSGIVEHTSFEYRERHKQGHWIWIECRGACVAWDSNGKPMRVIGTDTDISDRKAAEALLTHVSRRLELALGISQIGVFEVDTASDYVEWDDRMLDIYGKLGEPNRQEREAWEKTLHPDDRDTAVKRTEDSLISKSNFTNEFRIIRKDGEIRHIRARVASFDNGTGTQKIIGANWDVTEDISLQWELERAKTLVEARNIELETTRATIEYNAQHDFLTNIPNRRYLDSMLITKAEQASITNSGMAVLNIDLDRFKQINDTLGHAAGDMMLKHAAKIMIESTEPDDFIARIGGDEFVILSSMRGGQERLSTLADTIIAKLRKPVLFEGHTCRMGGSIGIAMDDSAQIDARQLLLRSDIALYQAKSKGRNRFEFFSSQLQNEIINNKHIADEILVALEKREFIPYYQLQFHADSLDVAGVESLARWIHPQKGVLTPDRFLDIAGDLDVVSQIDKHILEQALADLASWRLKGVAIPKVSVNVSASRLDDPELADKIAAFDIEPGTLAFELLETIFLDETDDTVVQNLKMLKKMGIEIEIDDFGTGHASIVSLLKTAPNALKIDRQLIRPIVDVADQRKLVRSIIEIGKSLNLKVVAEGVETQEHARILRDLGCDLLQGYALARPMAFHEIETYVEAGSWRF